MDDDFPQVPGVEHRFVEAGGLRVHVAEAGPPDAPPVLLLHGWPQHWYMWREVIVGLGSAYRLIAPDLRGFGWTDAPGHGYEPETFAADQIALLDELGIEKVAVIGHDWGAFTAFLLGIRHPRRIDRILALNAPPPWPRITPRLVAEQWRTWYAAVLASPLGPAAIRSGLPRLFLTRGNAHDPFTAEELDLYLSRLRQPERARATQSLYRHYERLMLRAIRDSPYRALRLEVPALCVFGKRDLYVSTELLRGQESHADDLRIELVADSGHFIVNERPELVTDRARAFLPAR